jgi:hypothetical protein
MPEKDEAKMILLASHGLSTAPFDGAFHSALNAPPYGRRRAPFQAPSKQNNHPITTNPTPLEVLLLLPRKATSQSS